MWFFRPGIVVAGKKKDLIDFEQLKEKEVILLKHRGWIENKAFAMILADTISSRLLKSLNIDELHIYAVWFRFTGKNVEVRSSNSTAQKRMTNTTKCY